MTTPTHVQVSPPGGGPNVDAQQLTSTESGSPVVDRQTVTIGDPNVYGAIGQVELDAFLSRLIIRDPITAEEQLKVLYLIARELSAIRVGISTLIGQPLYTDDDRLQSGLEKAH